MDLMKSETNVVRCTRLLLVLTCFLCVMSSPIKAQTGTAQLTINMTVQSSINLIFQNNPSVGTNGFCPLTNSGTNNVGLDLGTASFSGGSDLSFLAFINFGPAPSPACTGFSRGVAKHNHSIPQHLLG